ncbi:hypothetical protein V490_08882 [Pseudogymnoascus sp. VKM F-3557]|nr:hypothetical protein V490_08882 [Pseudogymnoascus sp. VKM F-3557]
MSPEPTSQIADHGNNTGEGLDEGLRQDIQPQQHQQEHQQQVKSRALSCLPCREHKLKCDRQVPCKSCVRSNRVDHCRKHPAPIGRNRARRLTAQRAAAIRRSNSAQSPQCQDQNQDQGQTQSQNQDRNIDQRIARNQTLRSPTSSYQENSLDAARSSDSSSHGQQPVDARYQNTSLPRTTLNQTSRYPVKRVSTVHMTNVYDLLECQNPPPHFRSSTGASIPVLTHFNSAHPTSLPGVLDSTSRGISDEDDQESIWKRHLCSLLPTQSQCDLLTCYYYENINWIFQSIHIPSFRKDYAQFWNSDVDNVDLIWMSLLYTILSISGLYIPLETAKVVGFESSKVRSLAQKWHSASRQALHAGGFEARPCITQLQTFSITQLYWYATNKIEVLNSAMAQAVRNAQAIGLDKDIAVSTSLEREMRHRAWWDLCDSDTFQSMCLNRPPLIQARLSKVPFPLNCNDLDITETSILARPIDQPTEMSMHYFRAKVFKILNRLYLDDSAHVLSYDFVSGIDAEIMAVVDEFPWYMKIEDGSCANLPPSLEFILWQFHILHTCICTQRIRMYRSFLHPRIGDSWPKCTRAAEDSFIVYRNIRDRAGDEFTKSQKFLGQAYQVFSVAVAIAALLIVERSAQNPNLRSDIEMAIVDLGTLDSSETTVSLASDGRKVLIRMLAIYDQRGAASPAESEDLVTGISTVFGGEQTARSYLRRCKIRTLQKNNSEASSQPTNLIHRQVGRSSYIRRRLP